MVPWFLFGDILKKRRSGIRLNKKIRYIAFVLVLCLLIWLVIGVDNRLRMITANYAGNRAKIIANSVINSTVNSYLEKANIKYSDLMHINSASDGTVNSVEFDTVTISKLKASVVSLIQENISKKENTVLSIPMGTLTGSQLFNGRGPKIDICLKMSSAVYSKISSTFVSAGINQTLHKITLEISTNVYFVMPWYRTSSAFETEFILAETIIVGDVPDAYTNVIEYPGSDMAGILFDYGAGDN